MSRRIGPSFSLLHLPAAFMNSCCEEAILYHAALLPIIQSLRQSYPLGLSLSPLHKSLHSLSCSYQCFTYVSVLQGICGYIYPFPRPPSPDFLLSRATHSATTFSSTSSSFIYINFFSASSHSTKSFIIYIHTQLVCTFIILT